MQRVDLYVPTADVPDLRLQVRHLARLRRLLAAAQQDFGAQCFWNIPADMPSPALARLAIERLRKHGGMAGWRRAEEIGEALQAYVDPVSENHPASHGA